MEKESSVKRDTWRRKIDFAFSVAGGFVGLGNIWRFPYLCFKNGGGAFLIPYVLFVAVGSLPVFFLEVALGQYARCGGGTAWKIAPILKGIGVSAVIINYYFNVYYAVILAWALRYFFASMSTELPWSTCGNSWNTDSCFVYGDKQNNSISANINITVHRVSSVVEFWENGVLGISSGVGVVGTVQWQLLLCLIVTWVVIYFCIWRGIGWTSKVVYVTASFPLLMLLVLLIRGVTLDGAIDGIIFYLKPDITKLKDVQVWLDAAAQVFFSYALCKGMMTTMGSYNQCRYNSYRDCIFLALFNSGVSFVSGFAIFSVLGFMAKEQGQNITEVAESGPGLAFIAYPKALTLMPWPQFWGCLFFFMLFLLGLDSEFVAQETLLSAFVDLRPRFFKKAWRKEKFLILLCLSQFAIGIAMITNGGVYVLHIFDNYGAAGWSVVFIGFCECAAVAWSFGITKFWNITCDMVGFHPFPWFKWCWMALTPIACATVFVISLATYKPLTYKLTHRTYDYPPWSIGIAWVLAMSTMVWIPGYAMYKLITTKGSMRQRWKKITMSEIRETDAMFTKEMTRRSTKHYEETQKHYAGIAAITNDDDAGDGYTAGDHELSKLSDSD